jgi:hypothetical protein
MASKIHLEAEDLSRLLTSLTDTDGGATAGAKEGALGVLTIGSVEVTVKTLSLAGTIRIKEKVTIEVREVSLKDGNVDVCGSVV